MIVNGITKGGVFGKGRGKAVQENGLLELERELMDQEGNKSFLRWLFAQRKLWQLAALIAIDVGVVIAEGFLGRLL